MFIHMAALSFSDTNHLFQVKGVSKLISLCFFIMFERLLNAIKKGITERGDPCGMECRDFPVGHAI